MHEYEIAVAIYATAFLINKRKSDFLFVYHTDNQNLIRGDVMKWKVSPFNDFIFKKLFGTVGNEDLLRAFLNAVMKDKNLPLIKEITIIEKLELEKNHFEEKLGIIDVGSPIVL